MPQQPPTPDRRQQLLAHAEDAFGESGYAGARIQEIAERAGIRRPSLLHHFADKDTLYAEVVVGIVSDLAERIDSPHPASATQRSDEIATNAERAAEKGSEDPHTSGGEGGPERLEAVIMAWIDFLLERPNAARVLLRHMIDPLPLPGIPDAVDRLLASIQTAIDIGVAHGENKPRDAAEFALVLASTSLVWVSTRGAVEGALGMDTLAPERIASHRELLRQLARQMLGAVTALR